MTKELLLLRHAKSSRDEPGLADIDRPLNGRGRKDAVRVGRLMAERGLVPDLALCSPAVRTRETLALVEEGLGRTLNSRIDAVIYMAEPRALLALLRSLTGEIERVMVVGHDPGLPGLALMLAKGSSGPMLDRLKQKFPTAALAVLTTNLDSWRALNPGTCEIRSFFVPKEI
ncbi:MAG: histidine phosphatase family protein [Alphaproteobacteria bacterium]|nr:histidine phosphatase family protein [Alphaproteobacteria bacterium]